MEEKILITVYFYICVSKDDVYVDDAIYCKI